MLHFIDYEVTTYDWLCVIINPITKTKTEIVNNVEQLQDYYDKYKNEIFIGYNIRGYDQYIMKGLLLGMQPQKINDFIIKEHKRGYQYSKDFNNIPLNVYEVMFGGNSLKKLEGFMGDNIIESKVSFDIDHPLTDSEIKELLYYCNNDVLALIKVFLERKTEFDSHLALIKEFNLPLNYIGKTQAQLAASILGAIKQDYDDEWEIRLPKELELHKYKYIADWFMDKKNQNYESSLTTTVCGVEHTFAYGGGHGAIPNLVYDCKPNEIMIMSDIAQMYPHLMTKYNLMSRSVTKPERYEYILSESLRLKALKKKKEREPYKRICNISYGATGDEFNAMYDPLHRNLVCVYGQVLMVMLLEELEEKVKSFRLLQNNTDGILYIIDVKDFDLVDDITYQWEQKTHLTMEFDYFKKVIQGDVNNYIAIEPDGSYKAKGSYFKELSTIDNDLPIVNKAIKNYLIKNIPVEKTIYECDDLMQFQQIVKISSKYLYAVYNNKVLNEKTLRVFASKDNRDGTLYKVKNVNGKLRTEKTAATPINAFIYNDSVQGVKCPDKLDKQWYVDLSYYRINKKIPDIINE